MSVAATVFVLVLSGACWAAAAPKILKADPAPKAVRAEAAPKPMRAERCASLQKQFGEAAKAGPRQAKVAEARKLADLGKALCASKRYSMGERRLLAALAELGVQARL